MMIRTTLALALVAAGCTNGDVGPCTPAPRWSVPYSNTADLHVLPDDTLLIADTMLLSRIGADGQTLATRALAYSNGGPATGTDETGAPAVAICNPDNSAEIDLYDSMLVPQRTFPLASCTGSVARGGAGQIAYTAGTLTTNTMVHALDPSGVEIWSSPLAGKLDYAANGNLVVYQFNTPGVERRIELAAATGAVVADVELPIDPIVLPRFARDGSYVVPEYLRLEAIGITRRDDTGAAVWTRAMHSLITSPVIATSGDVVTAAEIQTQVVRLDGATGTTIASATHCTDNASLIGATASGYLLRRSGSIESYAGP